MSVIKIISVTVLLFLVMLPGKLYSQQPGSLISFNVQPGANHSVMIQWEIKQAVDTPHFQIERSKDQKIWEKIGEIPAQLSPLYSFTDKQPGEGRNYYRVWKGEGENGAAFTEARWVQVSKTGVLFLWPNPAKNMLFIQTPFVNGRIEIVDGGGKRYFNILITQPITGVRTDRLAKGVYFIHVMHDKEILVERFVKG